MGGILIKVLTPGLYALYHLHQNRRLNTCDLHDPVVPCANQSQRITAPSHALGSLPSPSKAADAALVLVTHQVILLGRMIEFSAVL